MMGKPKIRFKGYNEDWEQRKLGEICQVTMGQSPNGSTYSEVPSDYILVQGNADLKDGWVEPRIWTTQKTKTAQAGDLIMSVRAPAGAMGKTAYDVVLGRGVAGIKGNEFVYQSLVKMDSDGYWKKMAAGSTFESINSDVVKNAEMPVPQDIEEQEKIGSYFIRLDHLITLHHRECVILRKTKVNDWEQRKLEEVFEQTTNFVNLSKDDIELWSLTVEDGLTPKSERYNREFLVKKDTNFKEVRPGDIVYNPMNMTLGAVGYNGMSKSVAVSGYYTTMITKDGNDSYYINTWLKSPQAISLYKIYATGSLIEKQRVQFPTLSTIPAAFPKYEEQHKIGCYFETIDHLITLHHRKCVILRKKKVNDWEQRKLGETKTFFTDGNYGEAYPKSSDMVDSSIGVPFLTGGNLKNGKLDSSGASYISKEKHELLTSGHLICDDIVIAVRGSLGALGYVNSDNSGWNINSQLAILRTDKEELNGKFLLHFLLSENGQKELLRRQTGTALKQLPIGAIKDVDIPITSIDEQVKIGEYFATLDHLITLHHHEEFCTENVLIYIEINRTIQIKEDIMAELESVIEQKLIDQLVYGDSQWAYRADLKTEEDLWNNFRYILEQNNKDRLNGEPLSDTEFEQVKNQLQFSSFYKAGEWLVGENGKVMVHVQRDTERLHLVVMNHEHIAGGSSVYEVINQYRALADEESQTKAQDRRFDVTLMINGLPMIHIELKNKQHSYMDGFWQIKKYIGEGKFTGIFSAVQMFVISNGVDTKYFSVVG